MTRNSTEGEMDSRLGTIVKGLNNEILNGLRSISKENASVIVDYISAMITERNPSDSYKIGSIRLLYLFSKYHKNKPFRSITRDEVILFLNTKRNYKVTEEIPNDVIRQHTSTQFSEGCSGVIHPDETKQCTITNIFNPAVG